MFTFHLVRTSPLVSARAILRPPTADTVPGLRHAECMTAMELGSPVFSPARLQVRNLAVFAAWDDEAAVDRFLASPGLGQHLADGWHVRLDFLRRWGVVEALPDLPIEVGEQDPTLPVVAVTLARLKHTQLPRFIKWGKPVERLVRDDPGATLAMAAMHPLNTVSTFTVWKTQEAMTDMVRGHAHVPDPRRHIDAMAERERKDFHFEFTTLRFRARSEHGSWQGRSDIVPPMPTPA
ncbi:MAG: hypothetical protein ACRBI6_17685 [Acidimicrobiales bacterium]